MAANIATAPMTKTFMNLSKTQYYGGDGSGRDTYIYMSNGGFCPEKMPCRMEELGMFLKFTSISYSNSKIIIFILDHFYNLKL